MEDIWPQIDPHWPNILHRMPAEFTTQDFRDAVESVASAAWSEAVRRHGPGGRGTGNFYSPSNVLYNYLQRKRLDGELLRLKNVPARAGWGAKTVAAWKSVDIPMAAEDVEVIEGERRLRTHFRIERAAGLRQHLVRDRSTAGLTCDLCGTAGTWVSPELRPSLFEVHHNEEGLARRGAGQTKLSDLSLLCACCHRLIHRVIANRKEWVTIAEAREILIPDSAESKSRT